MIDTTYSTEILRQLVRINSVNPSLSADGQGEKEIARFIYRELREMNIEAEFDEFAPGRVNVTGIICGRKNGKNMPRSLMLNAHMDTVGIAGMENPFSGEIRDGKLFGRGSYDMKGSIAAILAVARAVRDQNIRLDGDLLLTFVADEEYKSIGANRLIKKTKTDAAVVTEPTGLDICLAHRGMVVFKIITRGRTAHGGKHELGIDANAMMGRILAEAGNLSREISRRKEHSLCGAGSVHVPLVKGGRSLFIYANECVAHVERRTLPGETEQSVRADLEQILFKLKQEDPAFHAELETVIWQSPYEIDRGATIVKKAEEAVSMVLQEPPKYIGHTWWEDSAIFGEAGIETIILGPDGGGIHEEVEWVALESVHQLSRILLRLAERYCGSAVSQNT